MGLGLRVSGLGFRVEGLGFGVWGLGLRVRGGGGGGEGVLAVPGGTIGLDAKERAKGALPSRVLGKASIKLLPFRKFHHNHINR